MEKPAHNLQRKDGRPSVRRSICLHASGEMRAGSVDTTRHGSKGLCEIRLRRGGVGPFRCSSDPHPRPFGQQFGSGAGDDANSVSDFRLSVHISLLIGRRVQESPNLQVVRVANPTRGETHVE
ncbi:hypothetical protein MPTK1_2g18690 [Marchantia polymorpha subsp. ruderalis]|uniref:Uncharacterized protein n=1 Tax=Marchantia polymorpha TaxID=3197 RepID=A0A2R6W706_MARPO|nr:hypothetical protein MARPO_0137s0013 [Marchantia polymorpha]BBN02851.1 hypothetical protein Mp_2g18690 [Marchantia polymorpha subsp. ruderalis]|eukprot:PTQ29645.1 hypothetical protein MARPO_0137s0013 [Marchantia polymorpha]